MDHFLDLNNDNINSNDSNEQSNINGNGGNAGLLGANNIPTSTINDQDLLDFSGLDQFLQNNIDLGNEGSNDIASSVVNNHNLTPQIKEEDSDDALNDPSSFQPQSYHLTPSSFNNNKPSSSFTGVRRSLSKAMSSSRKNSIIKDEFGSLLLLQLKSPRSRKSSIVGTPGSYSGASGFMSGSGQTTTVERKRRDNINEKIQELLTIIPEDFFYVNDKSTGTKDGKPNKGQILTKSVEYIQFLQNEIDFKNRKEVEYIYKLKKLNYDTSNFSTSAEIGLGKIGVGPLSHLQREEAKLKWLAQRQANRTPNFNENFNFGPGSNGNGDNNNTNDNDENNLNQDSTVPNDNNNDNPQEYLNFVQ